MSEVSSGRIFLSYRREDTRHIAGRLFDRLTGRFGAGNVFMDVDSIEPGRDFGDAIESAVGGCDVLLALIGARWLGSTDAQGRRRIDDPDDLVALEVGTALDRDVRVIPVLVDGAAAPRRHELPDVLAPLARRNGVRLDHETFGTDLITLLTALDGALRAAERARDQAATPERAATTPAPPRPVPDEPTPAIPRSRRWTAGVTALTNWLRMLARSRLAWWSFAGVVVLAAALVTITTAVLGHSTGYTVTATIPVGTFPMGVALAPDGRRAYITNNGSNTVSVIDTGG